MSNITWKELRELVESKLDGLGIDENVEIEYIDFAWEDKDNVNVFVSDDMLVIQ